MTKGLNVKHNNLQLSTGIFFTAVLSLGQTAHADPVVVPNLILGGSQTISTDTDTGVVIVGNSDSGNGSLTVRDGAALGNGYSSTSGGDIDGVPYAEGKGYLGFNSASSGLATVTGEGSLWDNSGGDLYVGYQGQGTLAVENGGTVSSEGGFIGTYSGASGSVTVTGEESRWDNVNLYIGGTDSGVGGQGNLTINEGGVVSVFDNTTIWSTGNLSGNSGILDGVVSNYGSISPGNSIDPIGVLTITGDLMLEDSSTLMFDIFNPTEYDQLLVEGDFTVGGLLDLNFDSFTQPASETAYNLIYVGGNVDGAWGGINVSTGFDSSLLSYSFVESDRADYAQMLRLIVAGVDDSGNSVPEPASMLLLGLGGIMLQWQRRYRSRNG